MINEAIVQYAKSQNFAIVNSNLPEGTILKNQEWDRSIFLVTLDNTRSHLWTQEQILSLNLQLKAFHPNGAFYENSNDVLIIVTSGNIERDKCLSAIEGANVWLIDSVDGSVLIYENQPSDFYGLYCGIASAANAPCDKHSKPRDNRFIVNFPIVTIALIASNVIFFIILAAGGNVADASYMLSKGANYGPLVFEDLEVWRLVTSMFMHFSFSHLVSNMIYLAIAGYTLEHSVGHIKLFIIYMLSGIGASVVSAGYNYIMNTNTVSAGASGAIYGLIGVITFLTIKNMKHMRPIYIFYRIGVVIIFVFYSSFISSGVDGAAHIGGFIFGVILSIIFLTHVNAKSIDN